MVSKENKKLIFGVILTFIVCMGSAILALDYPNPGHPASEIGPGTFNASGESNPYWNFPADELGNIAFLIEGTGFFYDGLRIVGNPHSGPDFLVEGDTQLGDSSSDKTTVKGDLDVSGDLVSLKDVIANYKAKIESYDTNPNNDIVDMTELHTAVGDWSDGKTSEKVINIMVLLWKEDSSISSLPGSIGVAHYNVFASNDDSLYSALFTGGKGVKVEGDLNVNEDIFARSVAQDIKAKIEGYDTNNNNKIDDAEILVAEDDWSNNKLSSQIMNVILLLWLQDSSISGLPGSIGVDNYNVFASNDDSLYSALFTGGKGVKIEGDLNVSGKILHNNNPYVECRSVLAGNDNNWMTSDYYTGEQVCDHLGDNTLWTCEQAYYYSSVSNSWRLQACSQTLYKSYWAFGAHDVVGNEVGAAIACCR